MKAKIPKILSLLLVFTILFSFASCEKAPDKDLVWFENSAHGPMGEEPVKFKKLMREKFLAIAQEAAK